MSSGAWGTTVALLLAQNPQYRVRLWCTRPESAAALRERRENVRFLPGVPLPDSLEVTVTDNGVGIDKTSSHQGLGLTGINERVKEMDGRFSIDRGPRGGTVLQAILPVPASKQRKETAVANTAGG